SKKYRRALRLSQFTVLCDNEKMIPHDSPRRLAAFLAERGLSPKKRFGQNFLIDADARAGILALLAPEKGMRVWEIGPGLGFMTRGLLDAGAVLRAFEIDRGFIRILKEEFAGEKNFTLVEGDVLRQWPEYRKEAPRLVFGNLPYSVAALLIAGFLEKDFTNSRCIFMIQKEVASRMAAQPGTKNFSSFSLLCQTFMDVRLHGDISPEAFYPRPKVFSTLVELLPRPLAPRITDRGLYLGLVRALFASRRKTIKNNLLPWAASRGKNAAWAEQLTRDADIDPNLRGETLCAEQAVRLANTAADLSHS
ncbi:MAG: 16S rRNA (adenine(1518)-N(6)/adenine(1519)-N(6))-dimethyltransferase RsmA, partial [Spirochaetaceae bacterium]|nr:16S rRNA (adenine(1518)-N(6)/adenine(1519)-N(6))-dimethyltransferase RsmA [Spirochaetaceae bacterium]